MIILPRTYATVPIYETIYDYYWMLYAFGDLTIYFQLCG